MEKSSIEKDLEKSFCKELTREKGFAIKLKSISAIGLPDRLALRFGGNLDFVEFKDFGEKLRPAQKMVAKHLIRMGFRYYVVDSYETLNAYFEKTLDVYNPQS